MKERDDKAELMARMMGRLEANEGRIKKFEGEQAAEGIVTKAMKELQGYALSDDVRERILSLAREGGEKSVKVYVDAVRSHGVKEPGTNPEDEMGGAQMSELPAEVQKFSALGTDAMEKAIRHYNEWKVQRRWIGGMTLERYLAAQFAADKMGLFRPPSTESEAETA